MKFFSNKHRRIMEGEFFAGECNPYGIRDFSYDAFDVVLDLGANVGMFSLVSRVMFPTARIVAIEPDAQAFEALKENLCGLRVDCYRFALGAPPIAYLTPGRTSLANSYRATGQSGEACAAGYLPDVLKHVGISSTRRMLVKCDTEGAEQTLLDDPESLEMLRTVPAMGIEVHVRNRVRLADEIERWKVSLAGYTVEVTHAQKRFANITARKP